MNRERVPKGMGADRKRRPTHSNHQIVDVSVYGLPSHLEDSLIFFELAGPEVALHPVLQQRVLDGDVAFGRAME